MSQYSTNLTDKQWQVIEKIINPQERQRKRPRREIMNTILYINRTGFQWRMLPSDFAPCQTVYYYFRKWKLEGVIENIMDTIHSLVRRIIGREESPSMGIIDSRSVKTSHHVDSDRGIDGNKKIKGRKEHIVVDTLGIPMAVAVHEANPHDSKGAPKVIEKLEYKFPRLRKIIADGGYQGSLGDWVAKKFGWVVEVVLRPDECPSKFQVLPKRWIVERTVSWLRTSDGSPLTISIWRRPLRQWFNSPAYRFCLTNFSRDFKTASDYSAIFSYLLNTKLFEPLH